MAKAGRHHSSLGRWDEVATVRSAPRRVLRPEDGSGKLFFSPDLAPYSQHPLVRDLGGGVVAELLIQHLYGYLGFTCYLEHKVVNEVTVQLASGFLALPSELMLDAYKLYCDEGYHALASADMQRQVETLTGVSPVASPRPSFLSELERLLSALPQPEKDLARVLFVVVSETLISGSLRRLPADERVVTPVRALVADHARDESRHHAYFSAVFGLLWPQLTGEQRVSLGTLLPRFIHMFLRPDYQWIIRALTVYGLEESHARQVINDSYPEERALSGIRCTASSTLHLFERAGLMGEPEIKDAFLSCGLVG